MYNSIIIISILKNKNWTIEYKQKQHYKNIIIERGLIKNENE